MLDPLVCNSLLRTTTKKKEDNSVEKYTWASTRENLSSGVCVNKGADQHSHTRRLISAFVIRFKESILFRLATSEISIFLQVSVA